jgi:ABC-type antimicrobial peptide transport system permease subunit
MIWQRRPTLAAIKTQGIYRREVWGALFYESFVLLFAGCSIGAAFGVCGQLVISHALATVTGFPMTFSAGVIVAVLGFTIVSAAALAIIAIPGYLAAGVRPTTARPA